MNPPRPRLFALAGIVVVVGALSGCAPQDVDGTLWRQVAAFKDPFGRSLVGAVEGMATEDLAHGISEDNLLAGNYWDGDESSLESLSLVNGGAVIHNLEEHTPGISFDVLITSGPRDVEADTLANPAGPYLGPNSVFTCSRIAIGFETRTSWRWTDTDCDDALTGQLGPGAQLVSIHEFDG